MCCNASWGCWVDGGIEEVSKKKKKADVFPFFFSEAD